MWDYIGMQVRDVLNPPMTLVELEQGLIRAWNAVTPMFITRLIRSMNQRCREVIQTWEGHTHY